MFRDIALRKDHDEGEGGNLCRLGEWQEIAKPVIGAYPIKQCASDRVGKLSSFLSKRHVQ